MDAGRHTPIHGERETPELHYSEMAIGSCCSLSHHLILSGPLDTQHLSESFGVLDGTCLLWRAPKLFESRFRSNTIPPNGHQANNKTALSCGEEQLPRKLWFSGITAGLILRLQYAGSPYLMPGLLFPFKTVFDLS